MKKNTGRATAFARSPVPGLVDFRYTSKLFIPFIIIPIPIDMIFRRSDHVDVRKTVRIDFESSSIIVNRKVPGSRSRRAINVSMYRCRSHAWEKIQIVFRSASEKFRSDVLNCNVNHFTANAFRVCVEK